MGRLTANPELRMTPNGVPVCSFTVAVDRAYQKNGQKQTDFFNCIAWRATGEFVNAYFAKGKMIALEGSMESRKYVDKEGANRVAWELQAEQVHFCGKEGGEQSQQKPDVNVYSADDFEEVADDDDLPF
jgi:single-strand DNA-binding protein